MRIAIISGAGIVSGKEVMSLELGEGLRAAGEEVRFVTARWGNGEFARRARVQGFTVERMWIGFISATLRLKPLWWTTDQLLHWPALYLGYRRFLREFQPEKVIHTNWHHVIVLWPFLTAKRDIYWAHEVMGNTRQYRALFRRLSRRCGKFIAVSRATAEALAALGVPAQKVTTIYNGLVDDFSEAPFTTAEQPVKIGIIGQVGAWKGHEDLFHGFALVKDEVPAAELHVFGDGTPEFITGLRALAERLGIAARITWHGFVAEQQQIYGNLSVVIAPSRVVESFGMTAVEAALFKLPVVASRIGGLAEIVEDGKTGFLVQPERPVELANRIVQLLKDEDLRREMGEEARRRALDCFSRERMVRGFLDTLS